jgi:hypothetical protein
MYAKFSAFPVPKFQTPKAGDDAAQTQSLTKQLDITANKGHVMATKGQTGCARNFLIVPKLSRPKSVLIPSRKEVRHGVCQFISLFIIIAISWILLFVFVFHICRLTPSCPIASCRC